MNGFSLRPARPTDAGTVGAILSQFIDETPWMPRIHTRAEDLHHAGVMIDRGWVTVAENTTAVAGFAARDGADVNALYVRADYRNHGCGAALLGAMQKSQAHLTLWTFQANLGAQRFYQRHGFSEVERTDGAGNDEGLPDIRLVWKRGSP